MHVGVPEHVSEQRALVRRPSALFDGRSYWRFQSARSIGSEAMPDRSVLLVDDDPLLLDSLVRLLRLRFVVRTATSPVKALEILRSQPREYFAIISDVQMPEMDGPAFLTAAARIAPQARTVLMSGDLETADLVRAINGPGVFRCLIKPLPPARLVNALEDAWQAYSAAQPASSGSMRATT